MYIAKRNNSDRLLTSARERFDEPLSDGIWLTARYPGTSPLGRKRTTMIASTRTSAWANVAGIA